MEKIYDKYQIEYRVIEGTIPSNYSIWNAHLLVVDGKTYLKLYNNNKCVNFTVDTESLLALEVSEELGKIIDANLSGGRNPKEVARCLKSKDKWFKNHAEIIKPYIEKLFNTTIKVSA